MSDVLTIVRATADTARAAQSWRNGLRGRASRLLVQASVENPCMLGRGWPLRTAYRVGGLRWRGRGWYTPHGVVADSTVLALAGTRNGSAVEFPVVAKCELQQCWAHVRQEAPIHRKVCRSGQVHRIGVERADELGRPVRLQDLTVGGPGE